MKFKVYCKKEAIGNVSVIKQGLYYNIKCRLQQPSSAEGQLIAVCEGGETNLGMCGCVCGGWGLDRYLSEKQLRGMPKSFYFEAVWTVATNQPFLYIEKLENSMLKIKGGMKFIKLL